MLDVDDFVTLSNFLKVFKFYWFLCVCFLFFGVFYPPFLKEMVIIAF